jgi:integrase
MCSGLIGMVITQIVLTEPMQQYLIDLCYLTLQRSTKIRLLKWSDVDRATGVIHFLPTKTEDSSGIAVDIVITPEIVAVLERIAEIDGYTRIGAAPVIHALNGSEYAPGAFRAAFDRAELSEMGYTGQDDSREGADRRKTRRVRYQRVAGRGRTFKPDHN